DRKSSISGGVADSDFIPFATILSITTVIICSGLGEADGEGDGDGDGAGAGTDSAFTAIAGPMCAPIGIDTMRESADAEKIDADQETIFLGMLNYLLPILRWYLWRAGEQVRLLSKQTSGPVGKEE